MAIRPSDILAILAERIEALHPAPALFDRTEMVDWPTEACTYLVEVGILTRAHRADAMICPGCEWRCHKEVVVRSSGSQIRAFVNCDEEPGYGRINVSVDSLMQYHATLRTLAAFLASLIGGAGATPSLHGSAYSLGSVKGRGGPRRISILMSGHSLNLCVGNVDVPLTDVLCWSGSALELDRRALRRLADRKGPVATVTRRYQPDRSRQKQRNTETRRCDLAIFREAQRQQAKSRRTWTLIAESISGTDLALRKDGTRLSARRVRRIISLMNQLEREKSRSKRAFSK